MTCYIVTFEVANIDAKNALTPLLQSYNGYCPINANSWAIKSDKSAKEIREHLSTALQAGDRIFVIRSGTEAAWRNAYSDKNSEWLKKNL
jgi:Trk K+ transport system NAD-binding subunit